MGGNFGPEYAADIDIEEKPPRLAREDLLKEAINRRQKVIWNTSDLARVEPYVIQWHIIEKCIEEAKDLR